jgi:two-component system, response regulator YesN
MKSALILDDEPSLLKAMTLYLERSGYTVAQSMSSASALQKFQDSQREIDVFVADLTLDISSGVEVAVQLKQWHPGLSVVLMSGYPIETWDEYHATLFAQLPLDSVRVLLKPFSPKALLLALEELIGPGEYLTQAAG